MLRSYTGMVSWEWDTPFNWSSVMSGSMYSHQFLLSEEGGIWAGRGEGRGRVVSSLENFQRLRVSHLHTFPVAGKMDGDTCHHRGSVLQAEGGKEEAEGVCVCVCVCV